LAEYVRIVQGASFLYSLICCFQGMLLRCFLNDFDMALFALILLVSLLYVGAFAKFRKSVISFVMSLCPPSVRPHWTPQLPLDGVMKFGI
jgi:hypothetical protein